VLVFGLPSHTVVESLAGGEVARRALAAASFALVAIVIATGLRLTSLRAPHEMAEPPPVR
jgi:preprotein translocase subunit SecF